MVARSSNVRHGSYGVDAPYVPAIFGALSAVFLAFAVLNATQGAVTGAAITALVALWFLGCMASYLYTSKRGKFIVWSRILDGLQLSGSEQILDLGCGRGAVLLLAAEHLDGGKARGIDLWRTQDQTGNTSEATQRNAKAEGVSERVELLTADMTRLPFGEGEFDLVVSSLAIHNIKHESGRQEAVEEALRVLRPGGRLLIADFRHVDGYAETLRADGALEVERHELGWRFWYGGPWARTRMVTATKTEGDQANGP